MNQETLAAWIKLGKAEISPEKLRSLLAAYDFDPCAVIDAGAGEWREKPVTLTERQLDRLKASCREDVGRDIEALARLGARIVAFGDPDYPANLKQISDAPALLYVRGALEPDDRFSIAIVGSRRASSYGLSIAHHFARDLATHGLCIVSGGARGVDTRAHRGALDGGGRTVAFTGCGLDVPYPIENKKLYEEIVASGKGAVISEFSLGVCPEPWRFPARNRLISGMTMGTLVIESPVDSGAMITATDAAAHGREVFAVPGPIETGRNSGCHKLIREGAVLVQSPADILTELGVLTLTSSEGKDTAAGGFLPPPTDLGPEHKTLLEMLTFEPSHVDALIMQSEISPQKAMAALTILEMRGLARRIPGNSFVRVL